MIISIRYSYQNELAPVTFADAICVHDKIMMQDGELDGGEFPSYVITSKS